MPVWRPLVSTHTVTPSTGGVQPRLLGVAPPISPATTYSSNTVTNPIWEYVRDHQNVFKGVFAYGTDQFNLASGGEARNVPADWVSGAFFTTLGVRAVMGRTLQPSDDVRGCPAIAAISDSFWQTEYGGSAAVVGRSINLNSHPFQIVGVVDPAFSGLDVVDGFAGLIASIVLVIVMIVVLPIVVLVLLTGIEFLLLLVVLPVAVIARLIFGRHWQVEVREGWKVRYEVDGGSWSQSRAVIDDLAQRISLGQLEQGRLLGTLASPPE